MLLSYSAPVASAAEAGTVTVTRDNIGARCADVAADDSSTMQAFAQATAVYSWYAKNYFGNDE